MSLDREKLKKLAERATQGEWLNDEGEITCGTSLIAQVMTPSDFPCAGEEEDGIADELEANADLIAAGPSTILALLSELEAAERSVKDLDAEGDDILRAYNKVSTELASSEAALRTLREASRKLVARWNALQLGVTVEVNGSEITDEWTALENAAAEGGK